MSVTDPRLAVLAWELAARLDLERDLGIEHLALFPDAAPPSAPETLPADDAAPAPADDAVDEPAALPPSRDETSVPRDPTHRASDPVPAPARRVASSSARMTLMPPAPPELSDPGLLPVRDAALACTRCGLAEKRTQVAFGEGAVPAELMFVGEGPGREEDETGRPFVGPAGRLLTAIIERGLEVPRAAVYIANIVKCRPPGNRDPKPEEVAACADYLAEQIRCVRPKILVAVGKPAAHALLKTSATIGSLRGRWHEYGGIPLRVVYHPSYLLRERAAHGGGHSDADRKTWEDIKAVKARLEELNRTADGPTPG